MTRWYYMRMDKLFTVSAIVYLIVTAAAGIAALWATLWAYNLDNRMVSEVVTASIINTAAAVAAMGFFGGFDMIFTIWQFLKNQEAERARNQEREEERQAREVERKAREEERRAREEERRARQEEEHKARQEERKAQEEDRRAREQERRAREEEDRIARAEEREAVRAEREQIMAMLRAEEARREALTQRVLELSEIAIQRANGNAENGRGE